MHPSPKAATNQSPTLVSDQKAFRGIWALTSLLWAFLIWRRWWGARFVFGAMVSFTERWRSDQEGLRIRALARRSGHAFPELDNKGNTIP